MLSVTAFTLYQALLSTLLAALVGVTAAFFVARRRFFLRRALLATAAVPLCLPALIMALGYITMFGVAGFANRVLAVLFPDNPFSATLLYSVKGIVIAQGFYNFPLVMATVASSWAVLPGDQSDAARLLGASEARVFRTITLPQLLPAVGSACIPVFLFCFFSFMIILLFGGTGCTTLEVEIYHSVRNRPDIARAALLALAETGIALLAVGFYCGAVEGRVPAVRKAVLGRLRPARALEGKAERLLFTLFIASAALFFLAPLAGILWNALTARDGRISTAAFRRVFAMRGFGDAVCGTLGTAAATAILSAATAFSYTVFLRSHERLQSRLLFRVIPMAPMAVSSVVVGGTLTLLVRRGSPLLLVLAQTALFWPFAFRQVYASAARIPSEMLDAARLLSKNPLGADMLTGVYLPCCARGVLSAAGFCFAMSAGDTTLPLVLAIPHFSSLSLFTYRLAGSYRFHEACASGLVLALICAVIFTISQAVAGGGKR